MTDTLVAMPDTDVVHAVITIDDTGICFDISHGRGSGREPYGMLGASHRVEGAWRAVERVLMQREVETTEVHDMRKGRGGA